MTDDGAARLDARSAVHAVRRAEAEANARRRIAAEAAAKAARAETVVGQAEEIADRIFRTGTARTGEVDRMVDGLDLGRS